MYYCDHPFKTFTRMLTQEGVWSRTDELVLSMTFELEVVGGWVGHAGVTVHEKGHPSPCSQLDTHVFYARLGFLRLFNSQFPPNLEEYDTNKHMTMSWCHVHFSDSFHVMACQATSIFLSHLRSSLQPQSFRGFVVSQNGRVFSFSRPSTQQHWWLWAEVPSAHLRQSTAMWWCGFRFQSLFII